MFSPIKNTKLYEQVIEQIKDMIAKGILKKGDKLPSERELVDHLQVSRTSIREALRALQIMGLIECRQGEGNFISQSFEHSFFEPLSIMFMLQETNPEEIIEVRKVIEVETAAIAAKKITEEELESLEILIKAFKNSTDENDNVKIDKKFHYEIAQASRNFIILNILNAISSLIDSFIKDARKKILTDEKNREVLAMQHEEIYNALKKGDSKKAAEAMRKHLDFANEYMIK
ncbi:FadR family transcriptional regulator [Clostridium sp. CX1]|uniref:FadR/GntR family transcriptional regulator n=1 Tax=Clostridium tanneri TaxID=3037988 RepID=A0ABU4JQJ6_9CLOT|nr:MULTISPECIES: FadR/GntR family transcriptional regulator [unclassified Clostridium]MCT8977666.1 FadR family transcriptional regulator [Clostridium sp. CX1]MDW8800371.1 FadR/GntR family transcriptional regulator [Clostridium sp. A1-XYC3]